MAKSRGLARPCYSAAANYVQGKRRNQIWPERADLSLISLWQGGWCRGSGAMLPIYVDADACLVKEEVYRVGRRYAMRVIIVANSPLRVPADNLVQMVVRSGFGAADD